MSSTTIAARTITRILSSSSSFMFSPKPPSLLPSLLLRRPLSVLSSTMATLNSNSFAVPFIYTLSSPAHHPFARVCGTYLAASTSLNPTGVWPLPLRVSDIMDEMYRRPRTCTCGRDCRCGDKRHWLASLWTNGLEFQTEESLCDYYVTAIANVVGSEEEAKKRMCLFSCGFFYGFGVELEESDITKLGFAPGIHIVREDYCYCERKNDPNFISAPRFTRMNCNQRLENIFNYHYLSGPNKKWKDDQWLVIVKQPDFGFHSEEQILNFNVQVLAKVLGSEEEARKKIYVIWYKLPYGFGAIIDKDASNKLREMPDVLEVLPDYAFDVMDMFRTYGEALEIFPSSPAQKICPLSQGSKYDYVSPIEERGPKECFGSRQEQVGESEDPVYCSMNSDLKIANDGQSLYCKHWFIAMEKPGGNASMQQQLDGCIQTLANVSKSEKEEAKERVYRIECGNHFLGVGANINEDTANKLKGEVQVIEVRPDNLINDCPTRKSRLYLLK